MFNLTPTALLEQAKESFLSERFDIGFELIRECFDENDITDETILGFLRGEIGVKIQGNDVSFSEDIDVDSEYKEEIDSVLFEYRNFYKNQDGDLVYPSGFIPFKVNDYHHTGENKALQALIEAKNKLSPVNTFALNDYYITTLSDFMYITDDGIFFFDLNEKAVISEVSVVNDDIDIVINNFKKFNNL